MSAFTRWANSIAVSFSWKQARQAQSLKAHYTTTYFSTFSRDINSSHYTIAKVPITWQEWTEPVTWQIPPVCLPVCVWAPGSKCHIWPPNSSLTSLGRWASSGVRSSSRDRRGYGHTGGMVGSNVDVYMCITYVYMCVWPGIGVSMLDLLLLWQNTYLNIHTNGAHIPLDPCMQNPKCVSLFLKYWSTRTYVRTSHTHYTTRMHAHTINTRMHDPYSHTHLWCTDNEFHRYSSSFPICVIMSEGVQVNEAYYYLAVFVLELLAESNNYPTRPDPTQPAAHNITLHGTHIH